MLTRIKLFSAGLALVLFVFVSATCLAQQPQNQTQNQSPGAGGAPPFGRGGPGRHGHGPGGAGGPGMLGALRELNLTDDQKQQIHKIIEANLESTKTQHGELRQLMQKRFQGTLTADEEAGQDSSRTDGNVREGHRVEGRGNTHPRAKSKARRAEEGT